MAAGFAQAPNPLTGAQRESIVDFETGLFTAQMHDSEAKSLIADGANGGPTNFSSQDFYIGINDLFGDSVAQEPFDRWFLYLRRLEGLRGGGTNNARASVGRGE